MQPAIEVRDERSRLLGLVDLSTVKGTLWTFQVCVLPEEEAAKLLSFSFETPARCEPLEYLTLRFEWMEYCTGHCIYRCLCVKPLEHAPLIRRLPGFRLCELGNAFEHSPKWAVFAVLDKRFAFTL